MSLFGTKDLALLLPEDDVGGALVKEEDDNNVSADFKVRIDKTKKVVRHRPGQAPAWITQGGDAENNNDNNNNSLGITKTEINTNDSRLSRLAAASNKSTNNNDNNDNNNDNDPPRRRRVYEAEVIVDADEIDNKDDDFEKSILGESELAKILEGNDDDDDDNYDDNRNNFNKNNKIAYTNDSDEDITARRDRARKKLEEKRNENDLEGSIILANKINVLHPENESDSEYTDESSEEEEVIMKPVFIPKSKRQTLSLAETRKIEEDAQKEKERIAEEVRKQQTRSQLAESLKRMDESKDLDATDLDSDAGIPDTTDDLDDDLEFENWKLREILRLKRDSEEREKEALEKAEIMRRRNMTDEERYEEDKRLGKFAEKEKKKWKFLQKYYHKGVFFMDDDTLNNKEDVRNRDYSAPTLEDNYNKEVLPQVLQVKNFGKRGRTKYTHLVDQDTTYIEQKNRDKSLVKGELLSMNNEKVLSNYMSKRAGVGEIDPRESKRRKE